MTRPRLTRQHAIVGALLLLALILLAVIAGDVFFPRTGSGTQARTFAVQRGIVRAAVTGGRGGVGDALEG